MSYGRGPAAPASAPAPARLPSKRRFSWSEWWKPVKGTSAASQYSYYESDDDKSNNSRPGSKSGSRPGSRSGRFSLSYINKKEDDAARNHAVVAPNTVPSTAAKLKADKLDDGGSQAKNSKRKSTSRPPPAFFNRPYHQRLASDTAILQRPTPSYDDRPQLTISPPQGQRTAPQNLNVHHSVAVSSHHPTPAPPTIQTSVPPLKDVHSRLVIPANQERTGQERIRRTSDALQAPTIDPMIAVESMPGLGGRGRPSMDHRSRHGSSSTLGTYNSYNSAMSSRESLDGRMRSPSWGSQTSFESLGTSPQKTLAATRLSYANYQIQSAGMGMNTNANANSNPAWRQTYRPAPIKALRVKSRPGEQFAALPGEVLELILDELKELHLQPGSTSCATCWMRDCCAVALSARKWLKFARNALYEDIQLVGAEGTALKKRYKINHNARLVLLRRTLRNVPHIGAMVRSLKVPNMLAPGVSLDEYHSLVASVIMACPNFERLVGFFPKYDHDFARLFHALSTRQRLKQMNWIVEQTPSQRQHRIRASASTSPIAPEDLQPQQSQAFFDQHISWSYLTSLTVHCRPGASLTPDVLVTDALQCLPALQSLHLSHLPYTAFNDHNLLSLPSLKTLTLSHLPGITTAGLSTFATRQSTTSITSLTLLHINIDSLPALARIFANLKALRTFNLVQSCPPAMPPDEFIMLFPYLASPSLTKLHWDIPYLPNRASVADTILSRSISANGFPALRTIRAPNDPEGVFQSLCQVRERVTAPADRYRHPHNRNGSTMSVTKSQNHSRMGSRSSSFDRRPGTSRSPPASPGLASPSDKGMFLPREHSDLRDARLAAQARIEGARRFPRFFIQVVDVDGTVLEKHAVGGFMGTIESKIKYCLTPDVGASDEGGGLVGIKELLGDNGEEVDAMVNNGKKDWTRDRSRSRDRSGESDGAAKAREGCTGKWNIRDVANLDKKDRERLSHTERGRWKAVALS